MNVIADVAGQYNALMDLVDLMPDDDILFVGDLVDRGPDSEKVVAFAMEHKSLMGNHEHMMVDHERRTGLYRDGIWTMNGGTTTLASYNHDIPEYVVSWMEQLPLHFVQAEEYGTVLITHAFALSYLTVEQSLRTAGTQYLDSVLWSRDTPIDRANEGYVLQLAGHNAHWGYKDWGYAVCLDASFEKRLVGYNTKERKAYSADFR